MPPTPLLPDPLQTPAGLWPGDRIGRYRVVGEIGRGGMGVVYRAHDPDLDRDVAVKVLPAGLAGDPERVARLRAEARAASALDHPHVCAVYEVGGTEPGAGGAPGCLFVAMACHDGEALDDRLAHGPLPVPDAVDVARQVALALGAAHRKGIVHRDVKPSNVFLTTDRSPSGGPCVKLLDVGVAHVDGAPLTRPGTTLGTLEYAAPEQAHGHVGPASGPWGLGVLLYAVPEAVADVAERLLANRPEDRYATADAAAAALDHARSFGRMLPARRRHSLGGGVPRRGAGGSRSRSSPPAGRSPTTRAAWPARSASTRTRSVSTTPTRSCGATSHSPTRNSAGPPST